MNPRNLPRAAALAMLLIFAAAAGLLSCSDSESRMPFGQMATVVINLNLPAEHATAMNDSIWNTIRRLFARDAMAQTAPATFSQINVRVTGTDMGAVEQQFSPYAQISMSVPAGSFRQVEVTAYVMPGDPSAALSFRGTAITNLPAGETVSVPVIMRVNETRIVVADLNRIVIKNSMHSGWYELTAFWPTGIDFDSRGRIYIIDDSTEQIRRIDNINGDNPVDISSVLMPDELAVDRFRDRVFYNDDGNELYRNNLSGSNEHLMNRSTAPITITDIYGMDAASDGNLYIVGEINVTGMLYDTIIKYNPDSNGGNGDIISTSRTSTEINSVLNSPDDIKVKFPYLYVANNGGSDGYKILKVKVTGDTFSLTGHFGIQAASGPDTPAGTFYGPLAFVGLRNDGLIVTDNMFVFSSYSRLVYFGNSLEFGWDTIGGLSGSGVDQFNF